MEKEAKARIKINNLLQQSGWHFFDDKAGRQNIEVENNVNLEILGDDFEHSKKGFMDYLLLNARGSQLAVLEAKSQSRDPLDGKYQSENYAKAKRCRFVIL